MSRIPRIILGTGAAGLLAVVGLAGSLHAHAAVQTAGAPLAAHAPALPGFQMGTPRSLAQPAWSAYYDAHKDTYLNTDVSNKSQANSLHINFAPTLSKTLGASSPMYFVKGRSAKGQIAVFGSEPGESDYSPLWREFWVTWKAGAKPVLLVRDDQINSLAKSGKLTVKITKIVLNAPVTSVGK